MEKVYIYKVNSPSGLVVKIGRANDNPKARMINYASYYQLSVDQNSLATKDTKDAEYEETLLHNLFTSNGYRKLKGDNYHPNELFQSKYKRNYEDALRLFETMEHEPVENLESDIKQWKPIDLMHSTFAERNFDTSNPDCILSMIVRPNKDKEFLNENWNEGFERAVFKNSKNVMLLQMSSIKAICDKYGYILLDQNKKPYDFSHLDSYEQSLLAKQSGTTKKWLEWKPKEHQAAFDFIDNNGQLDFQSSPKHEHVFMTAKRLLQKGFSMIAI